MTYNLFIAYDLNQPGQNYEGVRDAIKGLGRWHQFQLSLFYVNTVHSPQEAYRIIMVAMDGRDKLAVIDAQGGIVSTWDRPPIDAINSIWFAP